MVRLFALLLMVVIGTLTACSSGRENTGAPVVLAAASLQDALQAVVDSWEAKGNPRPILSFAATPALARQIESGAPADLFISADENWMDAMESVQLIDPASRRNLLANSLVLVAPAGSDVEMKIEPGFALAEAIGAGRLAVADPDAVPAGRYGKQALVELGVWDEVSGKIAPAQNVRAALALVSQREAPLGIVYTTDAKVDPKVRVIARFPPDSHDPIRYPVALLKTSRNPDATKFLDYLTSNHAAAIFRDFGFSTER